MRDIDINLRLNLIFFQNSLENWLTLTFDTLIKDTSSNKHLNIAFDELLACLQDLSHRLALVHSAFDKVFLNATASAIIKNSTVDSEGNL